MKTIMMVYQMMKSALLLDCDTKCSSLIVRMLTEIRHSLKHAVRAEQKLDKVSRYIVGGYLDAVRFLLDNGAYINSRGQFGRTPLYQAAFGGHLEIVQVNVFLLN